MVEVLQKIYWLIQHPILAAVTILCLTQGVGYAQSNVWPDYLSVLKNDESEDEDQKDSNWLRFDNRASWYQTAKELNTIDWQVEGKKYIFAQQSQYSLLLYNRKMRDHIYSLPGSILKKNVIIPTGKIGLEWTPKLNYKIRPDTNTFLSTVDVGPLAEAEVYSVPIKVRTGISADVWKEAMLERSIFSAFKDYSSDAGYYLGCEIGDYTKPFKSLPLFFNIRASGRSIRNAGLGLFMGNMLFTNDLGSGDSIVFFVSDSLSNGSESYLNQGTTFTTSPWRILHNFTVSSGLKCAERLGFRPSGYYQYTLRTLKYPAGTELYSDMKSQNHKAGLQLSTENRFFFNYVGGIDLGWNDQNWMYNDKNINKHIRKGSVADSLLAAADNNDNLMFIAQMNHDVSIPLLWKFCLLYNFQISRESKNYKNYFIYSNGSDIDSMWNQFERDGVEKLHHLEISRKDSCLIQGGVYCDFGKVSIHNLRKEMSGASCDRRTMKMGGMLTFSLGKLYINEDIFFQGEKTEYVFKEVHSEPSKRPPQQRDFHSLMTGAWIFNDIFRLVCKWDQRYKDDGRWYGREYMLEETQKGNFYAIENKNTDYILSMRLEMETSGMNLSAGGLFRDTYHLFYNTKDTAYIPDQVGEGYFFEPYIEGAASLYGFFVKGKVKRNFNTIDPERWNKYENWDISLLLQKEW
jgi:hypothetical protein